MKSRRARPSRGRSLSLAAAALLLAAGPAAIGAAAQEPGVEPLTEHTLGAAEGAAGVPAAVADLAWLAGHWQGPGLGGLIEEVWSPPLGGGMMGSFRLVREDSVAFYEIFTLTAPDGRPEIRLKHFDPDLTGWEERAEVVRFPLLRVEPGAAWFDGLTFRRAGPDELRVFLAFRRDDGTAREEAITYYRVGSEAHRRHVLEAVRP